MFKKFYSSQSGITGLAVLLFVIFLVLIMTGLDLSMIEIQKVCRNSSIGDCWEQKRNPTPTQPVKKLTIISAKGNFSFNKYKVDIVMKIPLEGGVVEGTFSGTCDGTIIGTYSSGQYGMLVGNAFGSCTPLLLPLPASAEFSGKVNEQIKTVPISGTGHITGISRKGSITLTY